MGDVGNVGIVIPPDTRVQVNPTTVFPYWSIGQLEMLFPNGKQYSGTGTLIAPRYVLTCAHNLYGEELGGPAREVIFYPARDGTVDPYGGIFSTRNFCPDNYLLSPPPDPIADDGTVRDYTRYLFDYGLVRLQRQVDPGALMAMYDAPDKDLRRRTVDLAGYPGDKTYGTMWNGSDSLPHVLDEHFLFYRISTYKGQSGSAIRLATGLPQNPFWIVGVHVAGLPQFDANFAVRITDEIIDQVYRWMNE